MPSFGKRSLVNLSQCHVLLRKVMTESIKDLDFSIIQGYRNEADQEKAFREGTSKAHFGESAHNYLPCVAVDCIPHPFSDKDWENYGIFAAMVDHFFVAAKACRDRGDLPRDTFFRWGGGRQDGGPPTKDFSWDHPHFELHPWRNYVKGK